MCPYGGISLNCHGNTFSAFKCQLKWRHGNATTWISWFIFHNTAFPSISRTQSVESEYLSAASRLLSASTVLLPKLLVQYKAVNPSKEQVFTVCPASARSWLRHNHRWANEAWANWSPHQPTWHHVAKHETVGSRGEKLIISSWRTQKCCVFVGCCLKVPNQEENHTQNTYAGKASILIEEKKIFFFLNIPFFYFLGIPCSVISSFRRFVFGVTRLCETVQGAKKEKFCCSIIQGNFHCFICNKHL